MPPFRRMVDPMGDDLRHVGHLMACMFSLHGHAAKTVGGVTRHMHSFTPGGWTLQVVECTDGSVVWAYDTVQYFQGGTFAVNVEFISHRVGDFHRAVLWRIFVGRPDMPFECVFQLCPVLEPEEDYPSFESTKYPAITVENEHGIVRRLDSTHHVLYHMFACVTRLLYIGY